MIGKVLVILLVVVAAPGFAHAQTCNLSGTWQSASSDVWNLREDSGGSITGDEYSVGAPQTANGVIGTRTGTAVSLGLVQGGMLIAGASGTEGPCGSMTLSPPTGGSSVTLVQLSTTYCGDGVVGPGEQCDDGNFVNGDLCTVACMLPFCGNGAANPGEQCDDGNTNNNDACENNCRLNICGDGVRYAGVEQCDLGAANSAAPDATCRPDCTRQRCGDAVTDPQQGEQCDDGNSLPGDGCDASCLAERMASGSLPAGGGTLTTDPGGMGATPAAPLQAAIVSPNAGAASIVVTSLTVPPPAGYQLVGKEIDITAPPGSPTDPLRFTFDIDPSVIPAGEDQDSLAVFRNGVAVPDCLGASTASPNDPCVTERTLLADGNVEIGVLTSHASLWTVGKRLPQPISGAKLLLKDNPNAAKKGLTVESKDAALTLGSGNGSSDDPTLNGGSLSVTTIAGCNGPCSNLYALPKEHWSRIGPPGANGGYKYADEALAAGPIKSGTIRPGKLFKMVGKGSSLGHALGANPAPVGVTLKVGGKTYCMTFGGTTAFKAASKFTAKAAPAGSCS